MVRPWGVTAISALHYCYAAVYMLSTVNRSVGWVQRVRYRKDAAATGPGAWRWSLDAGNPTQRFSTPTFDLVRLLYSFFGVGLFLLLGIGLWNLDEWARVLDIVLLAVALVFRVVAAVRHFRAGASLWRLRLIGMGIELWTLAYLLNPSVQRAFEAASS